MNLPYRDRRMALFGQPWSVVCTTRMHNMQITRRLPGNANRSYYGTSAVVSFERRTFNSLQPGTTTHTHSLLQHRTPYQLGSNVECRMSNVVLCRNRPARFLPSKFQRLQRSARSRNGCVVANLKQCRTAICLSAHHYLVPIRLS